MPGEGPRSFGGVLAIICGEKMSMLALSVAYFCGSFLKANLIDVNLARLLNSKTLLSGPAQCSR